MKNIKKIALILAIAMVLVSAFSVISFAGNAETATEAAEKAAESSEGFAKGMGLLAAAIVTSLAGIGGGIAIASGAPAAIAANAENPKTFGKSIIFVALGESIILFGFVVSILILQKV